METVPATILTDSRILQLAIKREMMSKAIIMLPLVLKLELTSGLAETHLKGKMFLSAIMLTKMMLPFLESNLRHWVVRQRLPMML